MHNATASPYRYGQSLRKMRTWYADEETTDEETTTQPEAGDTENSGATEQTFTQAQVNAMNARTNKDARKAAEKAMLEQFGVSKASELKTLIAEANTLRESQMSDLEKAQQKADLAEANHTALQTEIENLKAQQKAGEQRHFLTAALGEAGAKNADDLYVLLRAKDADKINTLFAEGTPTDVDLKKFVTSVQASHELYFQTAGAGSPSTQGGLPPTSRQAAIDEARAHIKRKLGK